MSDSATRYVDAVNEEFRHLVATPTAEVFSEYEEACKTGVLDPDVVEVFNRASSHYQEDFDQLAFSIRTTTPEADFLFMRNGYTVVARESGITAVHAALIHTDEPLKPDPVEAQWPGYSNMGLQKAGRAVMPASHTWSSLGHATGLTERTRIPERKFAGSTGSLFMFGVDGQRDIRSEILGVPEIAQTVTDENDIDLIAGLADEERAIAAIGPQYARSVNSIARSARIHIARGDYLH